MHINLSLLVFASADFRHEDSLPSTNLRISQRCPHMTSTRNSAQCVFDVYTTFMLKSMIYPACPAIYPPFFLQRVCQRLCELCAYFIQNYFTRTTSVLHLHEKFGEKQLSHVSDCDIDLEVTLHNACCYGE